MANTLSTKPLLLSVLGLSLSSQAAGLNESTEALKLNPELQAQRHEIRNKLRMVRSSIAKESMDPESTKTKSDFKSHLPLLKELSQVAEHNNWPETKKWADESIASLESWLNHADPHVQQYRQKLENRLQSVECRIAKETMNPDHTCLRPHFLNCLTVLEEIAQHASQMRLKDIEQRTNVDIATLKSFLKSTRSN